MYFLADGINHLVRTAGGAQVEAQLVKAALPQRAQVLLGAKRAVGVQVLIDAGVGKAADDAVVFLDFHERLEVHVRDARRLFSDGKQQIKVALAVARAANLPQPLANRRNFVKHAKVVAERAVQVALVRFANRA